MLRFCAAFVALAAGANAQIIGTEDWGPQWFQNDTSDCAGRQYVGAECAELNDYFTLVDEQGGYFKSEPHRSATGGSDDYHYVCTPSGVVSSQRSPANAGTRECGFAIFRIYCAEPTNTNRVTGTRVQFRFEMSYPSDGRGPNDDSVYASLDGVRVWDSAGDSVYHYHVTRIPQNPRWGGTMPAFPEPRLLAPGVHYLGIAEREDGAMLRHVEMIQGYPTCTFGEPAPTTSDLAARVLEMETVTNNRVSVLEGQLETANAQISTMGSQIAASISTQVASVRADLQAQNRASQVDVIESQMAAQALAVPAFVVAGGSGSPRSAVPLIESDGQDIKLQVARGGSVKVSSAECFETDLCELAQSVAAITDALRQA